MNILPPGAVPPEAISAVKAEPGFAEAMRTSAAGLVQLYQGSHLLNWLMDDRGRVLLGYFALYLHFTGELTPTRVKTLCVEFGAASPGRVGVMLNLMRFSGYLAPAPASDRRLRGLVATDKLIALLVGRWRLHFAAMTPLICEGRAALERLEEPAFIRALTMAMFDRYRAGFRFLIHAPDLGLFGDRNAGILIASHLVSSGDKDDTVPPAKPVPVSVTALARRFAVSRTHVLTLLRDAAAEGLIERAGSQSDHIRILPRLAEAMRDMFAALYLYYADCAREALAALDERERAA